MARITSKNKKTFCIAWILPLRPTVTPLQRNAWFVICFGYLDSDARLG